MRQETATILLADDSRFFLTIERQFLSKTPATILEAQSCTQALALCRERRPNLVYLAFDLPDGNGAEFCRQLKGDPQLRGIPVILVFSAYCADRMEEGRGAGCEAVLIKPLDRHRFLEIGRSFLAGIRERRRPCLITVGVRTEQTSFTARGLDIGSGGVFLETARELAPGTRLDLDLHLARPGETGPRITCAAVVAWRNTPAQPLRPNHPPGLGVKFTDVPFQSLGVLHGFLRTLEQGRAASAGTAAAAEE